MDRQAFAEFLSQRGFAPGDPEGVLDGVERFAARCGEDPPAPVVPAFAAQMIHEGANTPDLFWALALYGRFVGDHDLTAAVLSFVDGGEALGNLHARMGDALGEEERDRVFAGIDLPPLGTPATELPRYARDVLERLAAEADPAVTGEVLAACLRDLDPAWYAEARAHFEEHGDVDLLLQWRRDRLMETLEACHREGRPWYVQDITAEVLDFVRAHPEVSTGVREGATIVETKIPHMTREWLAATDERERRYHYCHCPWVKESLRGGDVEVPAVFCACSGGFHKRFWEVVLGRPLHAEVRESVLAGDDRCTLVVHLPPEVVPD
ncbi:MAG: hypothetical protein KQH83_08285 [Actinobacteria bacterium]|nr:hypothetical protein [Actinomycetota bacterium]